MSQLHSYQTTSPRVRHVAGREPTVAWQRRQGPYPRWLRVSALLLVAGLITLMVAPIF